MINHNLISVEKLVCSRLDEMDSDDAFNKFYASNPDLNLELEKLKPYIQIIALVPLTGQQANVISWKEFTILVMTRMPEQMQAQIALNMQRFFELEQ